MRIFAIADLHLPGNDVKPMEVFGEHWTDHFARISADWRARVGEEDLVLLAGDLSWATLLEDALDDLRAIRELPGQIVLLKGNHDYWWNSVSRLRGALPPRMYALQHSAMDFGEVVVCGTRGWNFPMEGVELPEQDRKIYAREVGRLELALQEAARLADGRRVIAMMHYPPLYDTHRDTAFTALLERYGVSDVVYGHLHGAGIHAGFQGEHNGVRYRLTSCDSLDFRLCEVAGPDGAQSGVES